MGHKMLRATFTLFNFDFICIISQGKNVFLFCYSLENEKNTDNLFYTTLVKNILSFVL